MGNSFFYSLPGALFFGALAMWLQADLTTAMGRATRFTGTIFFSLFTVFWLLCLANPHG